MPIGKHRIHGGLTIAVAVKPQHSQKLKRALRWMNRYNAASPYGFNSSDTTLFASGVVLPAQTYCKENDCEETFVLATSYCGPLKNHLEEIIDKNSITLQRMFSCCAGFDTSMNTEELYHYFKRNSHRSYFTSRFNCFTKAEVENEQLLHHEIDDYLDKAQSLHAFDLLKPPDIKRLIGKHIETRGNKFNWAQKPDRKTFWEWCKVNKVELNEYILTLLLFGVPIYYYFAQGGYKHWFLPLFSGLCLSVAIITLCILATAVVVKLASYKKTRTAVRPEDALVRQLNATQLKPVLNEMTATAPLKAGWLRRQIYALLLAVVPFIYIATVPTVSSVRWLVINKKRRLLFLSNYVNTTDFYVRDFLIGATPDAVNIMFSNGQEFPDAGFMFLDGIRKDPEGYMNAVHTGQRVTDFWYAHDANITIYNIEKNRKIRNGLFKKMDNQEAAQWLRLL